MTFYSHQFFLFAAGAWAAFWLAPARFRWAILLACSYWFCLCLGWRATALLLAVSLASYLLGLSIAGVRESRRFSVLSLGIVADVLALVMVKYVRHGWVAAAGVSFYVFQSLSYLIDIYLERIPAERHLGRFLLYLAFFPKLMQGPIERAEDLLPQCQAAGRFDRGRMIEGVQLVILGLFKKAVIADRLAFLANAVFDKIDGHGGVTLLIGLYAYCLQLYLDFSGYTDVARGVGKLFGIELRENFNQPFLATTVPDFWRRWHMSFTAWLRDYLFTPIMAQLRALGTTAVIIAAMTTFVVCGLWHGAGWGFLIFGALHGVYVSVSLLTLKKRDLFLSRAHIPEAAVLWARRVVTFHLVAAAFVFFRCASLGDAAYFFSHLWSGGNSSIILRTFSPIELGILGLSLLGLGFGRSLRPMLLRYPALFWAVLANAVIFLGIKSDAPFLYFRF